MDFQVSIYQCMECGFQSPIREFRENSAGEQECPCTDCHSTRIHHLHYRPAQWVSVALFEVGQAYGGPEEGGWYYSAGSLLPETMRNFEAGDFPQATLYAERLRNEAQRLNKENRHLRYSVCHYLDRMAPAGFPSVKPTYC